MVCCQMCGAKRFNNARLVQRVPPTVQHHLTSKHAVVYGQRNHAAPLMSRGVAKPAGSLHVLFYTVPRTGCRSGEFGFVLRAWEFGFLHKAPASDA